METLEHYIEKAKASDACEEDLKTISKYSSIEELLEKAKPINIAYWAYWYAREVIKGRWLEAEPFIKKKACWAYNYAKDVIKGRFIEAEPFIKKDAKWAYGYAKNVIKGRFIEAEPFIMKNPEWACLYKKHFNI